MMIESAKQGYKKTEIGIIPEDWIEETFKDVCWVNQGLQIPISRRLKYPTIKSKKYITIQFLKEGEITQYIDGYTSSVCCIEEDILMTRTGNTGIVVSGVNGVFHNNFFKIHYDKEKLNREFLIYYLNQTIIQKIILEKAGTSTIPDLNHNDFFSIPCIYPKDLKEQEAIALVLFDIDELIESLNKLIAKKKDLKQGTMQLLLTGKKRLDGFDGEWEEKDFTEVAWFQEGPGLRNWQFTKSGMKVINVTNLENGYLNLERTDRHISLREFKQMYTHFEIDNKDIVVASSGNSYAKVSVVREQDLPLMMNTSVIRFKPLKNISYNFLLAFLKSPLFKDQIDLLITGGAQPNFGPYHLRKIKIYIPQNKDEQEMVGTFLSSMDEEIEALEKERDKYIMVKKGMMQQLLTGSIRLK